MRLKGQFEGYSRDTIREIMRNPRMLLLGAAFDENEVSTILGKCLVSRSAPPAHDDHDDDDDHDDNDDDAEQGDQSKLAPEGSFCCNYDIVITSVGNNKNKTKITIKNCQSHAIESGKKWRCLGRTLTHSSGETAVPAAATSSKRCMSSTSMQPVGGGGMLEEINHGWQ
jgi:hypothetical protein